MGEHIAEVIIKERKANGPYKDITDFLERITDKDLNKKSLESLIKGGALDKFAERGQLLGNIDNLLHFSKEASRSQINGQTSLFAQAPVLNVEHKIRLISASPAGQEEKLVWEKELLGVYISEHPFSDYEKYLENIIVPLVDLSAHLSDKTVNIAGVITSIKKIMTRANESMLFVKIEDRGGSMEILVFPSLLKVSANIWQEGKVALAQGKLSDKDSEIKLLANKAVQLSLENIQKQVIEFKLAKTLNKAPGQKPSYMNNFFNKSIAAPLKIIFNKDPKPEILAKLKELFSNNFGESKVYFKINQGGESKTIETGFRVNRSKSLVSLINREFDDLVVDDK